MKEFVVLFKIVKGLGPENFEKAITVGFDDIDPETSEAELRQWAIREAEGQLYNSDDFRVYGKNWTLIEVYET